MVFEFNDLKGFLFLVLFTIPQISSINIDCKGKPFHCLDSFHFMICVDLGGGRTSTIDDFVISCPATTVCHESNRYECEFPKVKTTTSPSLPTTSVKETYIPVTDSTTTTLPILPIEVSTMLPLKENNIKPVLTVLKDNTLKNIDILEKIKEDFTDGKELVFKATNKNSKNSAENTEELIVTNLKDIIPSTDKIYNIETTTDIFTVPYTMEVTTDTPHTIASTNLLDVLIKSNSYINKDKNITNSQFATQHEDFGKETILKDTTTPSQYENANKTIELDKPPDENSVYNQTKPGIATFNFAMFDTDFDKTKAEPPKTVTNFTATNDVLRPFITSNATTLSKKATTTLPLRMDNNEQRVKVLEKNASRQIEMLKKIKEEFIDDNEMAFEFSNTLKTSANDAMKVIAPNLKSKDFIPASDKIYRNETTTQIYPASYTIEGLTDLPKATTTTNLGDGFPELKSLLNTVKNNIYKQFTTENYDTTRKKNSVETMTTSPTIELDEPSHNITVYNWTKPSKEFTSEFNMSNTVTNAANKVTFDGIRTVPPLAVTSAPNTVDINASQPLIDNITSTLPIEVTTALPFIVKNIEPALTVMEENTQNIKMLNTLKEEFKDGKMVFESTSIAPKITGNNAEEMITGSNIEAKYYISGTDKIYRTETTSDMYYAPFTMKVTTDPPKTTTFGNVIDRFLGSNSYINTKENKIYHQFTTNEKDIMNEAFSVEETTSVSSYINADKPIELDELGDNTKGNNRTKPSRAFLSNFTTSSNVIDRTSKIAFNEIRTVAPLPFTSTSTTKYTNVLQQLIETTTPTLSFQIGTAVPLTINNTGPVWTVSKEHVPNVKMSEKLKEEFTDGKIKIFESTSTPSKNIEKNEEEITAANFKPNDFVGGMDTVILPVPFTTKVPTVPSKAMTAFNLLASSLDTNSHLIDKNSNYQFTMQEKDVTEEAIWTTTVTAPVNANKAVELYKSSSNTTVNYRTKFGTEFISNVATDTATKDNLDEIMTALSQSTTPFSTIKNINNTPQLIDSITTILAIEATTAQPLTESNTEPILTVLEENVPKNFEILKKIKDEFTDGNETIFESTGDKPKITVHNAMQITATNLKAKYSIDATEKMHSTQTTTDKSTKQDIMEAPTDTQNAMASINDTKDTWLISNTNVFKDKNQINNYLVTQIEHSTKKPYSIETATVSSYIEANKTTEFDAGSMVTKNIQKNINILEKLKHEITNDKEMVFKPTITATKPYLAVTTTASPHLYDETNKKDNSVIYNFTMSKLVIDTATNDDMRTTKKSFKMVNEDVDSDVIGTSIIRSNSTNDNIIRVSKTHLEEKIYENLQNEQFVSKQKNVLIDAFKNNTYSIPAIPDYDLISINTKENGTQEKENYTKNLNNGLNILEENKNVYGRNGTKFINETGESFKIPKTLQQNVQIGGGNAYFSTVFPGGVDNNTDIRLVNGSSDEILLLSRVSNINYNSSDLFSIIPITGSSSINSESYIGNKNITNRTKNEFTVSLNEVNASNIAHHVTKDIKMTNQFLYNVSNNKSNDTGTANKQNFTITEPDKPTIFTNANKKQYYTGSLKSETGMNQKTTKQNKIGGNESYQIDFSKTTKNKYTKNVINTTFPEEDIKNSSVETLSKSIFLPKISTTETSATKAIQAKDKAYSNYAAILRSSVISNMADTFPYNLNTNKQSSVKIINVENLNAVLTTSPATNLFVVQLPIDDTDLQNSLQNKKEIKKGISNLQATAATLLTKVTTNKKLLLKPLEVAINVTPLEELSTGSAVKIIGAASTLTSSKNVQFSAKDYTDSERKPINVTLNETTGSYSENGIREDNTVGMSTKPAVNILRENQKSINSMYTKTNSTNNHFLENHSTLSLLSETREATKYYNYLRNTTGISDTTSSNLVTDTVTEPNSVVEIINVSGLKIREEPFIVDTVFNKNDITRPTAQYSVEPKYISLQTKLLNISSKSTMLSNFTKKAEESKIHEETLDYEISSVNEKFSNPLVNNVNKKTIGNVGYDSTIRIGANVVNIQDTSELSKIANKENLNTHIYNPVNTSVRIFRTDIKTAYNGDTPGVIKTKKEASKPHIYLTEQQDTFNYNLESHEKSILESAVLNISYKQRDLKSNKSLSSALSKKELNKATLDNSKLVFSCRNRRRGRYADSKDCRKFYICIGKLQPIIGTCPNITVFSENKKHCTRNLSHCVRNNQFHCIDEGRFVDFSKDNIYFICVKNSLRGFLRYKLQCQNGYYLNKLSVKCEQDVDSTSKSTSFSENYKIIDQNASTLKSEESEISENKKYFICESEGKFPYPNDCRKYYKCSKNKKGKYRRKVKKCSSDEVYDEHKKKCKKADSDEC